MNLSELNARMDEIERKTSHPFKKVSSLLQLQSYGLNVPKYWLIRSSNEIDNFPVSRCRIWGVRCDSPNQENRLPFYAPVGADELREIAHKILTDYPYLIIIAQEYIDFNDQLLAGKYYKNKGDHCMECFTGNRSIRQAIEDGTDLIRFSSMADFPWSLQPFKSLIRRGLIERFSDWPQCCVEWSIYPYPVGVLKQRIIYWEL
jgi:hypothetical protein